jgi:hypothetical protein
MKMLRLTAAVFLVVAFGGAWPCFPEAAKTAVITKVVGDVKVEKAGGQTLAAAAGMTLAEGDIVRAGPGSSALIKLSDGNTLALQENSHLQIGGTPPQATEATGEKKPGPSLTLLNGTLLGRLKNVEKGSKVNIGTSTSIAGVEGTTFSVTASPDAGQSSVSVMEGVVRVDSREEGDKSVFVGSQQMTRVSEWGKTVIRATGSGVASGRYRPPVLRNGVEVKIVRGSGSGKTREEAVRNALKELSGRVLRAKIGPEASVSDWLAGKADAYARLSAFIGAAAIVPKGVLPDGTIEVEAEADIQELARVLEQKVPLFEGAVVAVDDLKFVQIYGPQERLTTERAATLDAQRKLLETINGVCITSQTTVGDFALQNDVVKSKVEGVLRGAEELGKRYFSDGTVEVTMCVRGPALVEEINRAAKKDVLGQNYLAKPTMLDPSEYEQLKAFEGQMTND